MKIIISPSKTQNMNKKMSENVNKDNLDLSINLFNKIKNMNLKSLEKTLKIKGKLLDETYNLYSNFKISDLGIPAIDCYSGVVFKQLEIESYNKSQINYLNNHLVILSAMYGFLEPNVNIWPYRLDMTNNPEKINLYKYWQNSIDEYFQNEDIIINLASNEFSKMIDESKNRIINIIFLEEKADGRLSSVSYNAKKARGIMLNKIIKNQLEGLDQIKEYNIDGYEYRESFSNENEYYFIKKQIK